MIFKGIVGLVATAAILACAPAVAPARAAAAGLAPAVDLAAAGRQAHARGSAIMLAFTQASCDFCTIAKRDYLVPMHNDRTLRERVLILEVDIDDTAMLRDFQGRPLSRRDLSRRYQVTRVPTVIVVNHRGTALAAPVVGLLAADFYRLYLEQAVEEGLYKLRNPAPPG